jgi:hypothetical protein
LERNTGKQMEGDNTYERDREMRARDCSIVEYRKE